MSIRGCRSLLAVSLPLLLTGCSGGSFDEKIAAATQSLASALSDALASGRVWLALLVAFCGGLLSALTPCVYPLIPVTVRYFGGMQQAGRKRVVWLALVYVGGMVVLYATLGTLFASFKVFYGAALTSPWIMGFIALLCLAMGLSMLGAFTVQLPSSWNTRLSQVGSKSTLGALAMGLVSGLIAAPCTGPVLLVILALIAHSAAVWLGFALMVAFAFGIGLPFLALALSSGSLRRLPAGGAWMEIVKLVLATAMLVVTVYFLRILLPTVGDLLEELPKSAIFSFPLLVCGVVCGVLILYAREHKVTKLLQVSAALLLTVGFSLGLFGGRAHGIVWMTDHGQAMARAQTEKRPMIIDFTADWCGACKELEHKTYADKAVRAEAERFVSVMIDATRWDEGVNSLFARYSVAGLPAVVFVDSSGAILKEPRVTGFMPAREFLELMQKVR